MLKVSDLTCGSCYRCCTTNEDKRFRTPVLKSDWDEVVYMHPNRSKQESIDHIADIQSSSTGVSIEGKVIPDYQPAHTDAKAHGCNECKWLAKDGKCSQYEKRPFICKQYPFQLVRLNGAILKSVVTNNCHLGQTIFEEICKGNQEIIDYADKVFEDSRDLMTIEEAGNMADYAEENYRGFAILNI